MSLCCVPVGGETEEEKIYVDILENQVMDVSNELARVCYSPDFVSPLLQDWAGQVLIAHLDYSSLPFELLGASDSPSWSLYCQERDPHELQLPQVKSLTQFLAVLGYKSRVLRIKIQFLQCD